MNREGLLNEVTIVINMGLEIFASSLEDQECEVYRIQWNPPAENEKEISNLLDELL